MQKFPFFVWCEISCPQHAIINFYSAPRTMRLTNIRQFFAFIIHLNAPPLPAPVDRSPFGSIVMFWRAQVFFVKMPFQVATCNSLIRKCYSFVVSFIILFLLLRLFFIRFYCWANWMESILFSLQKKKDDKAKSIVVSSLARQDWKCNHFNANA